jgi:hypothetical protein
VVLPGTLTSAFPGAEMLKQPVELLNIRDVFGRHLVKREMVTALEICPLDHVVGEFDEFTSTGR